MNKTLIDRIDRTRETWSSELEVCRTEIFNITFPQNPLARLVANLDYLLVEAKLALEAKDTEIASLMSEAAEARNRLRLPKHMQEE